MRGGADAAQDPVPGPDADTPDAQPARSTVASLSEYVPLVAVSGNLLLYKYAPEAFDQEELLERVARQVDYDQRHYDYQTRYGKPPGGDRSMPLFSQEEVAGRKPDFVARDLFDTYRAKLDQLASALPTRYSGVIAIEVPREAQFDHSRGVLHKKFETGYLVKGLVKSDVPEIEDRVLYDFDRTASGVSSALALQLRDRFGYHVYDQDELIPRETPASMTRIVSVPLPRSDDGMGGELVLAMDHLLDVAAFPLDSSDAERMFSLPKHPGEMKEYLGSFLLFFDLEIEDILVSGRHYVVKANVLGAKLLGTRGELLKTYAPSDFPSAAAVHAQRKAEEGAQRAAVEAEQREKADAEARKQAEQQTAELAKQARIDKTRKALRDADIVDVRLGMTVSEAEKIIRRHMDVGWAARSPDKALTGLEPNRPYSHFTTFISTDGGEQIALFWHPDISDRIVAVTRSLRLPEGASREAVVAQLLDKYGDQPAKKDDSSLVWTADFGTQKSMNVTDIDNAWRLRFGTCSCELGRLSTRDLQVVEGQAFDKVGAATLNAMTDITDIRVWGGRLPGKYGGFSKNWDPTQWQKCGPMVVASINLTLTAGPRSG